MSKPICWEHIKDILDAETKSEIHANALILRGAMNEANPQTPFSIAMAEEVCTALFCKLVRRTPQEQR